MGGKVREAPRSPGRPRDRRLQHLPLRRDTDRTVSQQNVEIVRRVIQAFNEGAVDAVVALGHLSPGVTFDASQSVPGWGVYQGIDATRRFWNDWFAAFPFEEWRIEIEEAIDAGDKVFVTTHQMGRGPRSGVRGLRFANVFTLETGQIERVEVFLDTRKGLEAAGLSA